MINIYSKKEIEMLAEGGKILSEVLGTVAGMVRPGISTFELDELAEKKIREAGAQPAFLGYSEKGMKPYPASLCTSINAELVHCIPKKDRVLKAGDIISLDLGVKYKNLITDMATTVAVGVVPNKTQKLLEVTKQSLDESLKILAPGVTLGDLGAKIESYAKKNKFGVVRDLVGHGVGKSVHEDPQVPNYGEPGKGLKLKEGMVLAIEPMFSLGSERIKVTPDGWGIATADGSLSAHFEKTIVIVEGGYRILTE